MRRKPKHRWTAWSPCLFGFVLALLAGKNPELRALAPLPQGNDRPSLVLPESTDLNRVLRKVTEFFAQDPPKWDDGVRMMQDLLEGRILKDEGPDNLNDPFYSVYSEDQRLYIPFARYCQRLICQLPSEGLEAYRFLCDARALDGYTAAARDLDVDRLQRLSQLYFATTSGPQIVSLLADLVALRGEVARSLYLRQWLLDGYPDLSPELTRSLLPRQAHGLAMLGDTAARDAVLERIAQAQVDPVAVDGAKVPVAELASHPSFAVRRLGATSEMVAPDSRGFSALGLHRLWQYQFRNVDPYMKRVRKSNRNRHIIFGGQRSWKMPHRDSFRPGTSVTPLLTSGHRLIAVKDHDKLVLLDSVSGKVFDKAGDSDYFKPNTSNQVLQRVPVTDFGIQGIEFVNGRLYCTTLNKPPQTGNTTEFPFRNQILAYDPMRRDEIWRSQAPAKTNRVFYQTAPIAYRGYLYTPVRKKRSFCIAQLDAATGDVVRTVTVHSGGTSMLRVPAVQPVAVGNQLIHVTNAGAVAAFSLPHLELQWLRSYETRTRHMPPPKRIRATRNSFYYGVREEKLRKWKPIRPIVHQGKVILAPSDSDALLCLDAHSGKPVWILPRKELGRGTNFDDVIGYDEEHLYLAGQHLQCVELIGGRRVWEISLQHLPNGPAEGHGTLAGGHIYVPFKGGVYRFRTADGAADGVIEFPKDNEGEPNWGMPVRLQFSGSVLVAVSESGVAAYTVPKDLVASADSGLDRAKRMAASGDVEGALSALRELVRARKLAPSDAAESLSFLVRLTGEAALAAKEANGSKAAIETLDATKSILSGAGYPVDARLTVFRIECLDPKDDAAMIRTLRDRLADLSLDEMGLTDEAPGEQKEG